MKISGDREIARDLVIGKTEKLLTTETLRRGEKGRNVEISADPGRLQMGLDKGNALALCHPERGRVECPGSPPSPILAWWGGFCGTSASRRTPVLLISGNTASGSSYNTVEPILRRLKNAVHVLRAAVREIFDESAYDRFLQRTKAPHSTESYRAFQREREAAVARKPRCC